MRQGIAKIPKQKITKFETKVYHLFYGLQKLKSGFETRKDLLPVWTTFHGMGPFRKWRSFEGEIEESYMFSFQDLIDMQRACNEVATYVPENRLGEEPFILSSCEL